MDTSSVNDAVSNDSSTFHECVFSTRGKELSSVTAVAFGGGDGAERIIVGDRIGNVRECDKNISVHVSFCSSVNVVFLTL